MTEAQLEKDSTHVGSGSFKVDEDAMRRKTAEDQAKIWAHRRAVILDEMFAKNIGFWCIVAASLFTICATITVLFFWGAGWAYACFSICGISIPIGCGIWDCVFRDMIKDIRMRWNP